MSTNVVGHNTIYATQAQTGGANLMLGNQAVCPSDGTLTKMSMYLDNLGGGSTQNITASIYTDNAGSPNTLVDYSSAVTIGINAAAAWVDFTLTLGAAVTAGTTYWIAYGVNGSSTINIYRQAGAVGASKFHVGLSANPPPNSFGAGTNNNFDYSMYATYTETAVASAASSDVATGATVQDYYYS